ncbi:hypothetical protein BJV74DRAFT_860022, partial [Russula compacta]
MLNKKIRTPEKNRNRDRCRRAGNPSTAHGICNCPLHHQRMHEFVLASLDCIVVA